jgi:hypothetical protein
MSSPASTSARSNNRGIFQRALREGSPRMHVAARAMNRVRAEHEYSPGTQAKRPDSFHHPVVHHAKGLADMRTTRNLSLLALACAALLGASQATAASRVGYGYAAAPVGPAHSLADADQVVADPDGLMLKAGEFAWLPDADLDSGAPVTMLISLRDQRGYLYRDGRRIAVTTVSTGKPGHDTPTGVFPIMGKEKMHHSNKYDNAPMPWMQRLTRWGHALHAGNVRPTPASHGCVRLPAEFARQLYSLTRTGDRVVISQDVSPRSLAIAGADSELALQLGVTEPLPRIIRLQPGQSMPGAAVEAAGVGMTGF